MSVALTTFLFEAANFVVLAAALGWVLFRPVRAALERERHAHEERKADLEKERSELDLLLEDSRQMRARAERETAELRAGVLHAAQQEARQERERLNRERAARRSQLQKELNEARRADAEALTTVVARVAAESVQRLLKEIGSASLESGLAAAACSELAKLSASQRARAIVESAARLDASVRQQIGAALGYPIEERVVDELGAGVRITMAGGLVDATALAIGRRAAQEVCGLLLEQKDAP